MKKLTALLLCFLIIFSFTACGKKGYDRNNYKYGLSEYVSLPDISSFSISEEDEDYKESLENLIAQDLAAVPVKLTEGVVEDGDTTNIDYEGSVGGVAFTGGTAQGYNLTIGSGSFIDGFEEQLIGMNVGETKTITVTFPEGYASSTDLETKKKVIELSGKEAQFKVTVNYINRSYKEINAKFLEATGYDSEESYYEKAHEYTLKNCIYSYIMENSDVKDYPPEEDGTMFEYYKSYYTDYAQQNGASFESFLSANGMTETQFRSQVIYESVVVYACFDKMGLTLEDNAIEEEYNRISTENNMSLEVAKEEYPINLVEYQLVSLKLLDELAKLNNPN